MCFGGIVSDWTDLGSHRAHRQRRSFSLSWSLGSLVPAHLPVLLSLSFLASLHGSTMPFGPYSLSLCLISRFWDNLIVPPWLWCPPLTIPRWWEVWTGQTVAGGHPCRFQRSLPGLGRDPRRCLLEAAAVHVSAARLLSCLLFLALRLVLRLSLTYP